MSEAVFVFEISSKIQIVVLLLNKKLRGTSVSLPLLLNASAHNDFSVLLIRKQFGFALIHSIYDAISITAYSFILGPLLQPPVWE